MQTTYDKLKIAIIGQSQFGAEVYKLLKQDQHKIVGVFTIPDKDGRADPLGKSPHTGGMAAWWGHPHRTGQVVRSTIS